MATTVTPGMSGKYLTFVLAGEEYAFPVGCVREITRITDITVVPRMPAHVSGVINLRGKVVPVMDLRLRFKLKATPPTDETCIIVTESTVGDRRVVYGAIVDRVSEVLSISADEIEDRPDFGERLDTRYMQGIAKVKGHIKILLDLDQMLADDAAPPARVA
jgi:purine-binding chemotaxis protein CheW